MQCGGAAYIAPPLYFVYVPDLKGEQAEDENSSLLSARVADELARAVFHVPSLRLFPIDMHWHF